MISLSFHWLLTYLLHSTLLLGCAALLDWRRRLTARGLSSPLWRIALFGGFASASLQPRWLAFFADVQHTAGFAAHRAISADSFGAVLLPPLQGDAIDIAPLLVLLWLGVVFCGLAYLVILLGQAARELGRMPIVRNPALERSAAQLALRARISRPKLASTSPSRCPTSCASGCTSSPRSSHSGASSAFRPGCSKNMSCLASMPRSLMKWRIFGGATTSGGSPAASPR